MINDITDGNVSAESPTLMNVETDSFTVTTDSFDSDLIFSDANSEYLAQLKHHPL